MPGPVFHDGERVALRTVEREDAEFLQRNYNDPAVRRWMPAVVPETREDVVDRLDSDDGVGLLACVDGERVGLVSLFDVSEASGRAELAAWVAPEHRGHGYATDAARLLVVYAFAERRLHRLVAGTLATNDPARRTLERLGFREEGRQREHFFVDGEYVDRVVYGLLRREWEG